MTSLPNDPFPICPNYNVWYNSYNFGKPDLKESDCNWRTIKDLIQNITNNDEHQKTCITSQYTGVSIEGKSSDPIIAYKFSLPLETKVYHEYFIIDFGAVEETLAVFFGFSFGSC